MEERSNQLKTLGFKETKVGMTNEKYSFLWHQIESPTQAEWEKFIATVTHELKTDN